ncbi:hypothetical protein [Streptomyces cyslabdanicus]|uniref:hypothetical protein n=1 Tax=Streptomyces cyslabdanicus TaxID=1470456 RepID=UPI004043C446
MGRRLSVTRGWTLAALAVVVLTAAGCQGSETAAGGTGRSTRTPAAPTPDLPTPLNYARLKQTVPDLQSMPVGWKVGRTELRGRDYPKSAPCRANVCAGLTSHAELQYDNADSTGNVYIDLYAYDDTQSARSGYEKHRKSYASQQDRAISMPTVGNVSMARTGFNKYSDQPFVSIVMRVGTVVATMAYTHEQKADPQDMLALARLQAERIQQAQRGGRVTASLAGHKI